MKSYSIFACFSLLIMVICFSCTYFDPKAAAGVDPHFYWIDSEGKIFRAPLDNPLDTQVVYDPGSSLIASCITVDPLGGYVYWAVDDMENYPIHRVRINGKDEEKLFDAGEYVKSIAIDPLTRTIYFATGFYIKKAPLNKEEEPKEFFFHSGANEISDIILDFNKGNVVFASDYTIYTGIDMKDGEEAYVENLTNYADKIIMDYFTESIFYMSIDTSCIVYKENLPPDGEFMSLHSSTYIMDFAVDTNDRFLYCAEQNTIYRIPLFGGTQEDVLDSVDITQFTIDFIK
ncbi:MAG: hypothetical protein JXB88_06480 [Spirochaetales bacterium]|nr:hypothetical protein [Spirochaetales bacterium]